MFSVRPRFSVRRLAAASAFSAIALMLTVHPAAAQTTVIGFTPSAYGVTSNAASTFGSPGGTGSTASTSYSLGFAFTANRSAVVTSLGYFNDPSFDLTQPFNTVSLSPEPSGSYVYTSSHDVGLYQVVPATALTPETGLLLGSTVITSTSTPGGDFLYNTITQIALIAGNQYVLAGVSGSQDPYIYNIEDDSKEIGGVGLTVDPAFIYNQSRYTVSDKLAYAGSNDGSEPGFFGPNFQIMDTLPASAAPEPGQWSVLALAALGLGTLIVRVRRRQAAH